jgi:hypothetical protein
MSRKRIDEEFLMDIGVTKLGGRGNFNVQAPVGPRCVNSMEDVMLVQYLLKKLGQAGVPANGPALVQKMAAISPTGTFDQATADCILGFQKHFGGIADGRISVAQGAS